MVIYASPNKRAALPLMISGRNSSLIAIFSKSDSQRSGVIMGQSEPNKPFCAGSNCNISPKCLGNIWRPPDRSIRHLVYAAPRPAPLPAKGMRGARMIFISGKSTATSSIYIGFEYFRHPFPPGIPIQHLFDPYETGRCPLFCIAS